MVHGLPNCVAIWPVVRDIMCRSMTEWPMDKPSSFPLSWKILLKRTSCQLKIRSNSARWPDWKWLNQQQLSINRWKIVFIWQVEVEASKGNPLKTFSLKIQSELCFSADELWWIIRESVEAPPTSDMLLPNNQSSPTTEHPREDLCSIAAQWYIC